MRLTIRRPKVHAVVLVLDTRISGQFQVEKLKYFICLLFWFFKRRKSADGATFAGLPTRRERCRI
jgi:hypothetical protein